MSETFTQEQVDAIVAERQKKKNEEIALLKESLKAKDAEFAALQEKASGYDALRAEFDDFKGNIEREQTFRSVGLSLDGADEAGKSRVEKIRASALTLYRSETDGQADAPSFAEWLAGPAREHPLLSSVLPSPEPGPGTGTPPAVASPGAAPAKVGTPAPARGTAPPAPARPVGPDDIKARHAAALADARRHPPTSQEYRDGVAAARKILTEGMSGA